MPELRFVDVLDTPTFESLPPCADERFDHRTCDYWEDADRGSRTARPSWLAASAPAPSRPRQAVDTDNPFAPPVRHEADNPFLPASRGGAVSPTPFGLGASDAPDAIDSGFNPFLPQAPPIRPLSGVPRKLALLDRGRAVFGSYAKVALIGAKSVAYIQFGPLSAYPRATRLRQLYPQLPDSPLPAVITCVATTPEARRQGHAAALIREVCRDLAGRGFAAVEAYPDLTLPEDEGSAGRPALWERCGFQVAVWDERFPVMRREL
jgi:GNAT superfamily N-acetyltransferase